MLINLFHCVEICTDDVKKKTVKTSGILILIKAMTPNSLVVFVFVTLKGKNQFYLRCH